MKIMPGKENGIFTYRKLMDTSVNLDLRITIILALAGAIGNTLGFLANFFLYGMNFPTAFCAVCAFLIIINYCFGLPSPRYLIYGWIMLVILDILEFPLLVLTYGAVMFPYMIIGFLALLMLTTGKKRILLCTLLCIYDVAIIVYSSLHPYIFGPQDSAGLMGSAVITFIIALGALAACVISWQSVAVMEASDVDSVTGIFTRVGFIRNVTKQLNWERTAAYDILYFDIKSFKAVNSVYGIEGGDKLLRLVADKIAHSDLAPIYSGRLTADHFVFFVRREKISFEKINRLCRIVFNEKGKSMVIYMQCGIYPIEDLSLSVESMCDRAYAAARFVHGGQNKHYAVFEDEIASIFQDETDLLGELESALQKQQFEPYYQPIVDCKTKRIVSAEALARWVHPERGLIPPAVFIPILEKKELISELDEMIAFQVGSLLESQAAQKTPIVPISVNLSRIDLYDHSLMHNLQVMVKESQINDFAYRFELTESAYESLSEEIIEQLSIFRKHNALILVDDFGSGYSSLGTITEYEFDFIKLDMSFASKLDSDEKVCSVVKSLIEMIHNLGAKIIAEGVETKASFDLLEDMGCDYIQGYYMYKPLPKQEFLELLQKQNESK